MASIKVRSDVKIYEVDGEETPGGEEPELGVLSHWNDRDMVVLIAEGKNVTVLAADLLAAVHNAQNSK